MVGGSKVRDSDVEDVKNIHSTKKFSKSEDKQRTSQDVFLQVQDLLTIYQQ